jgi:hypothetical protein
MKGRNAEEPYEVRSTPHVILPQQVCCSPAWLESSPVMVSALAPLLNLVVPEGAPI